MSVSRNDRTVTHVSLWERSRQFVVARQAVIRGFFGGLLLGLFLTRFFYVAESADRGETLWIVAGWLVALPGWILTNWIRPTKVARMGWLGVGVGLWITGQLVSALLIVLTSGDQRAAINLAWEGLGIAIGWFLISQECRDFAFRRELLTCLVAAGAASAGLGLYQHYVEFPQTAAKYAPLFDRLKQAAPIEAASIRKTLASENIPADGPSLVLFEKRLRDSREPLGFFALANSFGGLLAVCLVLSVSVAVSVVQKNDRLKWKQLSPWLLMIVVLGWSLLLTKSRTAWIGTGIGLVLLTLLSGRSRWTGRGLRYVAIFTVVVLLSAWGLTQFGGLDRQVLTEAPKSLKYRLQYWQATTRLIADHLIFGVGPGQFRGHYLVYKLPEASEEIADPHNLFLETAASGGLVSLCGLIIICLVLFKRLGSPPSKDESAPTAAPGTGQAIILLACIAWIWLLLNGADDRLLVLLPLTVALFRVLSRTLSVDRIEPASIHLGWQCAAIALMCHLCGAGGIGMPVISLLLLVLISCGSYSSGPIGPAVESDRPEDGLVRRNRRGLWIGPVSLFLLVSLVMTGIRPVQRVHDSINSGDRQLTKGQLAGAESDYRKAEIADPWSSEATKRHAELAYQLAAQDHFRSNESFQTAVELLNEARVRNPTSFRDDLRLAEWWGERWKMSRKPEDAEQSVAALERAWARYPTNASLIADLAIACQRAGQTARAKEMAIQSLKQDDINHAWGHVDRYLEERKKSELESLVSGDES